MTPAGIGLVAASILLDLPSALARLFLTAVIAGLAGLLDWRGDLIVLLVAFGPYLRSVGALVVPLPAGPFLRQAAGARKPSERERAALQHAFSLLPDGVAPGSVLVVDGPDENAWVLGCTLFVERGLFESPHLAAVMAHEAGHLAAGDGRVALAAWWLPVRSAAWVAARLMGSRHRSLPQAGTALPQPQAAGSGAGLAPGLAAAAAAAEEGMRATTPLVAKKGRASYLGERSAGHQDPGATSAYLLLKTAADVWR